ncbi:MAG TPA: Pycsar system effector family protein [Verrucomicrobiae bacterium]|jgi:hypothetical protein
MATNISILSLSPKGLSQLESTTASLETDHNNSIRSSGQEHARASTMDVAQSTSAAVQDGDSLGEFIHQCLRNYITFADQKAAFVFTGVSAILAFVANKGALMPFVANSPAAPWTWRIDIGVLAALALITSAGFGIAVIMPRFTKEKIATGGLIFWEDICSHASAKDYAAELKGLTKAQAVHQVQINCFVLAKICRKKYRTLACAIWSALIGLALSVAYIAAG